jgi:hypothetical protein
MNQDPEEALEVLRGVWTVQGQTSGDLASLARQAARRSPSSPASSSKPTLAMFLQDFLPPWACSRTLLQRMRLAGRGQAFDGGDLAPVGLHGEHGARFHRLPVDEHRAGAAIRGVTTHVGPGQAKSLP